ncbi:MAG: thioredoxin family protein [Firmicutes bacterium]|nr:thioredoxin family protein [Bacillota bacterium]
MASDKVEAVAVDATSFMELAMKHQVYAVPKTVINDRVGIEGAVPERVLVQKIREALGQPS